MTASQPLSSIVAGIRCGASCRKDLFARGRRAGEQDFVRARANGRAGGFAGFGQQRDELRIEAGANDQLGQRSAPRACRRRPA